MASTTAKRVWAESGDGWVQGVQLRVVAQNKSKKARWFVVRTDAGEDITVSATFPVKHNGRRVKNVGSIKAEKLPTRHGRFRRRVAVVALRYVPMQTEVYADFGKMLTHTVEVEGASMRVYDRGIFGFNDNHECFVRHLNQGSIDGPTAGNAIARPWQSTGDAVAIPTGPYWTLEQRVLCFLPGDAQAREHTAKEIIDAGIEAIVALFLAHSHKDTLYYSVNHNEPPGGDRIGLAIFAGAVGDDVRDYITAQLKKVPDYVQEKRG